jgi:hypothetical protein
MQVKVLLPTTDVIPTLVHLAPALVAEFAEGVETDSINNATIANMPSFLFI